MYGSYWIEDVAEVDEGDGDRDGLEQDGRQEQQADVLHRAGVHSDERLKSETKAPSSTIAAPVHEEKKTTKKKKPHREQQSMEGGAAPTIRKHAGVFL